MIHRLTICTLNGNEEILWQPAHLHFAAVTGPWEGEPEDREQPAGVCGGLAEVLLLEPHCAHHVRSYGGGLQVRKSVKKGPSCHL
jgi:hypothetical protein